jgi:hypothetical protein
VGKSGRFAGARTRDDEERGVAVLRGGPLLLIEVV